MRVAAVLFFLACLLPSPGLADEPFPKYDRRWVWVMANLLFEKEADRVVALVERAGRDGYNGVVISTTPLEWLEGRKMGPCSRGSRAGTAASAAVATLDGWPAG